MNFREVEVFLAAAEHGTLQAAAATERATKSSISQIIRRLEHELGLDLLHLLILAGLATPLAAAAVIGTMAVATAPNLRNGFWAAKGGIELPFLYAVLGVVLAFTGPGQFSVDHVIGTPSGVGAGIFSVLLGSLAAAVMLWSRASTLAQRRARSE